MKKAIKTLLVTIFVLCILALVGMVTKISWLVTVSALLIAALIIISAVTAMIYLLKPQQNPTPKKMRGPEDMV